MPDPMATVWDHPSPFALTLQAQAADMDGLGHTNNGVYLRWCEQAAWAHSASLGLTLADYRRLDRAMVIRRGVYDYLLPTVAGEALTLATWLFAGASALSMVRRFQVIRSRDQVTVMRGQWELVCIALSTGQPERMLDVFQACYGGAVVGATGAGAPGSSP
jgi:acyl-CoA thioester hydrolase